MKKYSLRLPSALTLALCVCGIILLTTTPASAAEGDTTFFHIFTDFKNNAAKAIVMWILLLTSVAMMALIVELFIRLRSAKLSPPAVVALLRDALVSGNYQQALEICNVNKCFLTAVMGPAIRSVTAGRHAVDEIVTETFAQQSSRLKSKNNYLSVIGVVSPMIGLAGTVAGMMKAFAIIGSEGMKNMGGLASAISAVLIATLAGLIVAIPGFVFFYYFKNVSTIVFADAYADIRGLLRLIPFEQLQGMNLGLEG